MKKCRESPKFGILNTQHHLEHFRDVKNWNESRFLWCAGYEVEMSGQDTAYNALVFDYVVQDGHQTDSLDVFSPSALNCTVRLNAT